MAASIKDALKKAFSEKGQELPRKTQENPQNNKSKRAVSVTYGEVQAHSRGIVGRDRIRKRGDNPISPRGSVLVSPLPQRPNASKPTVASSSTQTTLASAQKMQASAIKLKPQPAYELRVTKGLKPVCLIQDEPDDYVYVAPSKIGIKDQAHAGSWHDEREVVIGLDFGTSSVKVIIGDRVLGKAFAVPFSEAPGIRRYLLPTRLYEADSDFLLTKANRLYRDLKLPLLADPGDAKAQELATAFLALVIRHARGWLLSEHHAVYHQTNIHWKLVVGMPASHHLIDGNQALFHKVAQAAWLEAASNQSAIKRISVLDKLSRASQLIAGAIPKSRAEEAEISVVPEIAAQIYGYVASNRFDRKAKNLYLMVDVGAGTVDSSLFQVKPDKGGRFAFSFYTSQVQPNGVMNLHRHRMQWWEQALNSLHADVIPELSGFMESKFATDRMCSIPENYMNYFSDIQVQYRAGIDDPDQHFFKKQLIVQVRGKTMWRTWKDNLLTQQDLNGIPMFLCGGGARMQFYRNIEQEMQNMPNFSWLKAESRPLEKPKSLVASGLPAQEYDRLSVAFGLSFLEVSEVVKATPIPQIIPDIVATWHNNYVDKDQC
jgi:hypothetical protein